ncbi:hypothetical protein [Herbiconiux sp. VKM Ac-1786]|uniref:hypothetical protein n=1 Tax=Herbiconiux sp. VKM Ac-1786 TaxID=2783824 RepID=UPI00351C7159
MVDEANDRRTPDERLQGDGVARRRRPPLLTLLAVIVGAEALVMAVVVVWLLIELLTEQPASYETALAIVVLAAIAALFLAFAAIHTLRAAAWTRAGTLTWQLFQIVIAIGCFQGIVATPVVGWWLLVPALLALGLLFTPSVVAATRRV